MTSSNAKIPGDSLAYAIDLPLSSSPKKLASSLKVPDACAGINVVAASQVEWAQGIPLMCVS